MAYADPQGVSNPTAGAVITAAWGDAVRDAIEHLARNKPHARVHNTSSYTHNSTGNYLAIPFGLERFDVGGCHSTVSNTSRLTVPSGEAGTYVIGGGCTWAASGVGVRQLRLIVNGSTEIALQRLASETDTTPAFTISGYYDLVAGDYVELQAFQNSGGSLDITASHFWFKWDSV
jgi:hypothetical protein